MFVAIVMIVSEWGEPQIWPAIIAFVGLLTTTCVGWWGIQPINREIKAGVHDEERLRTLLQQVDEDQRSPLGGGDRHVGRAVLVLRVEA